MQILRRYTGNKYLPSGWRLLAATLAVLWCLPLVGGIVGMVFLPATRVIAPADQPDASDIHLTPPLTSAASHAALCHCLHCSGGTDYKKCCCTGAGGAAERLVIRASCDDNVPTTPAAALVTAFKVTPLLSPFAAVPSPAMGDERLSWYAYPKDAALPSRLCPPPDQPPRLRS